MNQFKISSKDNEKIKFLRKLKLKKYRNEFSLFFVENLSIIYDGLKSNIMFDSIFVTETFIEKNKEKFEFILHNVPNREYYLISDNIYKSFSDLESPTGICAIYRKQAGEIDFNLPIIYLNGISDPGNLGAILRSAVAFDLPNVVLDETCVDIYNYKTIQAAKESIFKLNIAFDQELNLLRKIKKIMPIFSTRLEQSYDINMLKNYKIFCLVLGNETHGVDKKIQELADGFIKIEMSQQIESLNVASSAAIIFYNIYTFKGHKL